MNERFILIEPGQIDKDDVMRYRQEFVDRNECVHGGASLTKISDYGQWLDKIEENKKGNPPRTELIMVRCSDKKIVGMTNIRHSLVDGYEVCGGHIGYSIRPTERGQGYGNIILELSLKYCKELGIQRVLMTCDKDNIASKKVIQKNGGVFENSITLGDETIERYWITF